MFKDSTILITGGTGSWGQQLVSQLLSHHHPAQIRIFSRSEIRQVEMRRAYSDPRIRYYIGDIRDIRRLSLAVHHSDIIFHLAAMKQVPICEENPWEAIQTNIIGTQHVVETAIQHNVKKVIYVSSDKAVDPFNLYGATKSCGEQLILDGNKHHTTRFVSVRAGNVIGTVGSVIPLFKEQIKTAHALTITDARMTRFFMKIQDAIGLLLKAAKESIGGEILVMKMPACKIIDVAHVFMKAHGINEPRLTTIGIRPGEKLFETLVSHHEVPHTHDLGKYYVILPRSAADHAKNMQYALYHTLPKTLTAEYRTDTQPLLTHAQIKTLLTETGWL